MKKLFLFIILIAFGQISQAQTDVVLRFDHRLDGKSFAFNQEAISPLGTKYKLTRLQYYISGIKITHDGGQLRILNTVYLFVDPSKPSSKEFSLGAFQGITTIEKIEYAVGVDVASNHLDPASYQSNHPLAPKNPTMHWGWTSGYRFIAVEGKAARSNGQFLDDIAIHTVGDLNFKTKLYNVNGTVENGKIYIDIKAEYNLLFDGIILAGGNNNHSESGSAAVLNANASQKVFTPSAPTATKDENNNSLSETIYGADGVSIKYTFASISDLQFKLYNSSGISVKELRINTNEGILSMEDQIIPGNYFYAFIQRNQVVSTGRIVKANK